MAEIFTVDAFTDVPFSGNPAAVCVLEPGTKPLSEDYMQKIATEVNLSETAFVQSEEDISTSSKFSLKWFTPICEVNLCGHATLATAEVLFEHFNNSNTELSFATLSGDLKAVFNKDDCSISLDFPSAPSTQQSVVDHQDIIKLATGDIGISDCQFSPLTRKLLLRLPDGTTRSQLESLTVDTNALLAVKQSQVKGVIVTVKSEDKEYDFYSRYFAPWVGIPEDPVTGSAHTVLGPYWSRVLNKEVLSAQQCSSRGGDLIVGLKGERVTLTGKAVIVIKGKINI